MARENEMMVYRDKLVASVKVGGRILREHDRDHVYLPFGSEYSILLKNMENRRASVSVKIDGEDVLSGHQLIINAKQTLDLERFIVNGNLSRGPRFKFVEKTAQISEHRGDRIDDGIIEIDFQFEVEPPPIKSIIPPFDIHHHYHYDSNPIRSFGPRNSGDMYGGERTVFSSCNSNVTGQSVSGEQESNVTMDSLDDAGITVKGQESNQGFSYGYIGQLETAIHNICIKLHGTRGKGVVHAPVTVQAKYKCEVCGTSNTSRNKFCGSCGNNLNW